MIIMEFDTPEKLNECFYNELFSRVFNKLKPYFPNATQEDLKSFINFKKNWI